MSSSRAAITLVTLALCGCTSRASLDASGPLDAQGSLDAPGSVDADTLDGALPDALPDGGGAPVVFVEPGGVLDRFGGSDRTGIAPSIVYPRSGVLMPPNLGGVEIHFIPNGYVFFEIEFSQSGEVRMLVYDDCNARGAGCALALSDAMWSLLAGERSRGEYTVRVRGVGAVGGPIGESVPITMELAEEAVTGGLYFWSTSPPAIHRYDFDRGHRESEVFYDEVDSGGRCIGCHALSRDGHTIAIGYETGSLGIVDVASRLTAREVGSAMGSFSPDASEIVVGGSIRGDAPISIERTDGTGAAIPLGLGASPDWSPDGDTIVATSTESGALLRWDHSTTGEWIQSTLLVDADLRFPAFAPDSEWIAFSRMEGTGSAARVWALGRDGRPARMLARASVGTYDSMPRWNPSTFLHRGSPLFWITFTSDLTYGVEPPSPDRRAIWMAAFQPASTEPDPSRPPFLLPQQPSTGSNFIPQWTSTVDRQACAESVDCRAGEICSDGICVPDII